MHDPLLDEGLGNQHGLLVYLWHVDVIVDGNVVVDSILDVAKVNKQAVGAGIVLEL